MEFSGPCTLCSRLMACGIVPQVFKALRGGVQTVAVKILHDAELGGDKFVREIAILKGCRHSNIVQFQASNNRICRMKTIQPAAIQPYEELSVLVPVVSLLRRRRNATV